MSSKTLDYLKTVDKGKYNSITYILNNHKNTRDVFHSFTINNDHVTVIYFITSDGTSTNSILE